MGSTLIRGGTVDTLTAYTPAFEAFTAVWPDILRARSWAQVITSPRTCSWTDSWWDANREAILARVRRDHTATPDEVAAYARACVYLFALLDYTPMTVAGVATITGDALTAAHPAPQARPEPVPAPSPRPAPTVKAMPRKARAPRVRQVVFATDMLDQFGRLLVAAGEYGDVVQWPLIASPRVRVTNVHGQTITLPVPRRYLARVPL